MLTDTLLSLFIGAVLAALCAGLAAFCIYYPKVFGGFWILVSLWVLGGIARNLWRYR